MHFSTLSSFTLLISSCAGQFWSNRVKSIIQAEEDNHSTQTVVKITQTISLYGLALDKKDYTALDNVYTKDALVDLGRGPIFGLEDLKRYYQTSSGNSSSFHSSQNVYVSDITENTATASSDAIAVFFAKGHFIEGSTIPLLTPNQTLTFYEYFLDKFVLEDDGYWRISHRNLTIYAIVGDLSIES